MSFIFLAIWGHIRFTMDTTKYNFRGFLPHEIEKLVDVLILVYLCNVQRITNRAFH